MLLASETDNNLTHGFISTSEYDDLTDNPYILAAQNKGELLCAKAIADFACLQFHIETIIPIFNSAAYPLIYQTDKLAGRGKEGQALFDKPGQHYGGENLVLSLIRKMRAIMRATESKTYKIVPV